MVRPSRDQNSQKYIDDPNREWYEGQWRTQEQIERKREQPSRDQNNQKYIDENREWYGGSWRTQEQIERYRERDREQKRKKYATDPKFRERERERSKINNSRRLVVSGMYLGMVGFTEKERKELLNVATD